MKRFFLSLFVILSFVSFAVTPSKPDDEEDPYFLLCGQADKAIADGDYNEAAARLIDAISLRPDAPESVLLMSNLGMVYCYMDRDSLALSTLNEALRRAPAMRTIEANRGKVLLKMGRDREAFDSFTKVIDADSLNQEARYFHGTLALYSGRLADAEADFDVLKNVDPKGTRTAQALSALYSMTGREREAIPYFQTLIDTEPSAEFYGRMAACQLEIDKLSDAGATLAEGMKKFPDDAALYYYRAKLNKKRYRTEEAHKDASTAIRLGLDPALARAIFSED